MEQENVLAGDVTPLPIRGKLSKVKKRRKGPGEAAFFVIFGGTAHFILREQQEYFIKTGAGSLPACFRRGQESLSDGLGQTIFMEVVRYVD